VDDTNCRHARSTPNSVPSAVSNCHSNCLCDNINDDNKESVNGFCAGRQTEGSEIMCEDDVVVGDVQGC
jgi:hypothetical protein